jgi:hypothetical protein
MYENLKKAAEDKVYKFAYILGVNKIPGAAAGTVLRPIGIV